MKRIETGSTSFENLIESNSIYVDKTGYLYDLIDKGMIYYFLSRPVGFGKTLTISTLEALFKGKRKLFKGLYIDSTDYDWKEYPVVKLDYGRLSGRNREEFAESLNTMIKDIAKEYGIDSSRLSDYYDMSLSCLLDCLAKRGKVAVLVNDFDKVLIEEAYNPNIEDFRSVILGSLEVLKASYEEVAFVFVTGVSAYTMVTWYSTANNFYNISKYNVYSAIMGYTIEEIEKYFDEYIELGMKNTNLSRDEYMDRLRKHFKEYRFQKDKYRRLGEYDEEVEVVYNPTYIDQFFANGGYNFTIVEEDTPDEHFLEARFKNLDCIAYAVREAMYKSEKN